MHHDPSSRRFPRAAISLPCVVDDSSGRLMRGRLWSATCDGVGLGIEHTGLVAGSELRVTFRILGEAIEVPARVVWRQEDGCGTWAGAALTLSTAPDDVPPVYAHWLLSVLHRERAEACRSGALLAIKRTISLRNLQAALDAHATIGGSLAPILATMGLHAAASQLATTAAAETPIPRVALPPTLIDWARQWSVAT